MDDKVLETIFRLREQEANLIDAAIANRISGTPNYRLSDKLRHVKREIREAVNSLLPNEKNLERRAKLQRAELARLHATMAEGRRINTLYLQMQADLQAYLPPDGITKDEFVSRIIEKLDPPLPETDRG